MLVGDATDISAVTYYSTIGGAPANAIKKTASK